MATHRPRTIGSKLWTLSGMMLLNIFAMGLLAVWNNNSLLERMNSLTRLWVPAVRNVLILDAGHHALRAAALEALSMAADNNGSENNELSSAAKTASSRINTSLDALHQLPFDDSIRSNIEAISGNINALDRDLHAVLDLAIAKQLEQANARWDALQGKLDMTKVQLDKLTAVAEAQVDKADADVLEHGAQTNALSWVITLIGLIVGLANAAWVIRNLQSSLRGIVSQLSSETGNVTSVASRLHHVAKNLTDSTNQQARALQETAASVDEITAMIKKTSENSVNLEHSAVVNQQSATKGNQAVIDMLAAIGTISESNNKVVTQVEEGNQKITEIVKVISEIGNKTKIINDIVFQTKLLSFNASVEAARAGEHGKGFAVVAEEVGNLAQMSGNAAKDISDMLSSSIQKVEGIVNENKQKVESLIAEGRSTLSHGKSIAKQCEGALEEIVRQSSFVNGMIGEISTAIREQNQGIQAICRALDLLDEATQQNMASSQDTSDSSDALLKQSQMLHHIVKTVEDMTVRDAMTSDHHAEPSHVAHLVTAPVTSPTGNVVNLKTTNQAKPGKATPRANPVAPSPSAPLKKAVGAAAVPDHTDPRFEEV